MSFQFRFDSILRLRCRERDDAGVEVGNANEAIRRVQEQINEIQQQRDEIRIESSGLLASGTNSAGNATFAVDRILQRGRFDLQLQAEMVALEQTVVSLKQERDRRLDLLVLAEAEVKRIERLRETQQAEYYQDELKREQAEADDMTTARMVIARLQAARLQAARLNNANTNF